MTNINYRESTIKVGTFFSGVGSPEKAFQKLKQEEIIKDFKLEFFSEINKDAIKSYCAIHNVDEKLNLGNILDIKGIDLPYCDLWIGGFPCQDISCAGNMKGFNFNSATRSSLGWEMIRLIKEVKEKPTFDNLIVNCIQKDDYVKSVSALYFLDDSIKNCVDVKNNTLAYSFLMETEHNEYSAVNTGIERVSWNGFYENVKKLRRK